jgi:hypothetical protein
MHQMPFGPHLAPARPKLSLHGDPYTSPRLHRPSVTQPITRGLAAAVFASALFAGCTQKPADKSAATAQQQSMLDMGAMSMPVTIPKGAIYT